MTREKSLEERLRDAGFSNPDPLGFLDSTYPNCLEKAAVADDLGDHKEAAILRKTAARTLKTLRQYGRNPA